HHAIAVWSTSQSSEPGLCGDRSSFTNRLLLGTRLRSIVDQDRWDFLRGPTTPEHDGRDVMKRTWTIIGVSDVPRSFRWYQSLFGQAETEAHHTYFGQILDSDGTVLLCLHQWGAHEHPSLMSPDRATPGNGLLLFFRVDDFDMSLKRARALVARLEE